MTSENLEEALREALRGTSLSLSEAQVQQALGHARLLLRANRRTNLTRITEPREVAERHFVESFLAASLWGVPPADGLLRVLDVGSGGGFPGLAGRILRPEVDLTCLEPRAAKAAFLSRVAALLPPPTPRVRSLRLEDFHPTSPMDAVTFRALHVAPVELERVTAPAGRVVGFPGGEETWSIALEARGWHRVASRSLPGAHREVVAWSRND